MQTMIASWLFGRLGGRVRALGALMLVLGLFGSLLEPDPTFAARSAEEAPLDLAAMVLTPADLETIGLEGYRLTEGYWDGPRRLAFQAGWWTSDLLDEEIQAILESAGLERAYGVCLRLREDPDDPGSSKSREVYVTVHEFADTEGAADGFALLDELGADTILVERVEGDDPIGVETILVRDVEESGPQDLEIAFRTDRIVGLIRIRDYTGQLPAVADAEALAARTRDRIEAGLAGGAPGLAYRVLRLADSGSGEPYEVHDDQYLRLAGEDVPFDWETTSDIADRAKVMGDAIDAYELNQLVQGAEAEIPEIPDRMLWRSRVYHFVDDEAAAGWLRERLERPETGLATKFMELRDVVIVEAAPVAGDDTLTIAFVREDDDGLRQEAFRTYVRTGATVMEIELRQGDADVPPIEAIYALAEAQLACLDAAGCPGPVEISDALAGDLAPGKHGAWRSAGLRASASLAAHGQGER